MSMGCFLKENVEATGKGEVKQLLPRNMNQTIVRNPRPVWLVKRVSI